MNWKELGRNLIGKGLPLLGTALGGPGGGMVAGLVTSALGLSDAAPDEVYEAIKQDPRALVELQQLQMTHKEKLAELSLDHARLETESAISRIKEVNATMQVEAKSEHWPQYSWRPFWGFVSALAFLVVCIFVCVLGYRAVIGGEANALSMIPQLVSSMALLFGIPGAILGVSAWHRGKEKTAKAQGAVGV